MFNAQCGYRQSQAYIVKIPGLCFYVPTTKFTLFWDMGNWNFANILTNQASKTLLLLGVLPHFSKFHWFYIVKTYKWGSIANSWTVPHQFWPLWDLVDLGGIRDGHKTWGTVQELDIEDHFWIFTMLTWQKLGKWGKTAKKVEWLKKPFLAEETPKTGFPHDNIT